jgi:hypothetical protein
MELLILGALVTAFFFVCLFGAYTVGKMDRNAKQPTADFELDDEELEQRERAKRLKKGFDEMMAYNEAKARKG